MKQHTRAGTEPAGSDAPIRSFLSLPVVTAIYFALALVYFLPAFLPGKHIFGTDYLVGGYIFGVYAQNISSGAYLSTLTLITGLPEVLISVVKATTFGLIAGLVGCYRGLTVRGGAKGVGTAVNETLVLCVVALFAVNVVLTTIGVRFGTGR